MSTSDHLVAVLDDEPKVLRSLKRLLTGRGFTVRLHSDPEDFFRAGLPDVPSCLLLDHQLGEEMTGIEVQAEMLRRGWTIPIIFLTAHWNVHSIVRAMRAGADGFLTKPYDSEELVQEIRRALDHARKTLASTRESAELRARAARLTKREHEIVSHVITGRINKEIAHTLGLSVVTVKIYRGRAMRKLGAGNAAELARLAALAGITGITGNPP